MGAIPALPTLPTAPPTVPEGVFDRVSKLVTRIKASLNYTDNIGSDLGILSSTTTIDVTTMKPDLSVRLDVDRNDGTGFVLLGRYTKNGCIDVVSLAAGKVYEEWKYKGIYVISDTQVGLYSNVVSIDVKKI